MHDWYYVRTLRNVCFTFHCSCWNEPEFVRWFQRLEIAAMYSVLDR